MNYTEKDIEEILIEFPDLIEPNFQVIDSQYRCIGGIIDILGH